MSKKSFVIISVLSVIVTYGMAVVEFNRGGLPLKFADFGFLGGSTDLRALLVDVIFWFIIIFLLWKIIVKIIRKH